VGPLLNFLVALLVVSKRFTLSAAQAGLVLSYILSIQQTIGTMVVLVSVFFFFGKGCELFFDIRFDVRWRWSLV